MGSRVVWFLLFLCVLFSASVVDAHFVCGEVNGSVDGLSSDWFSVDVFYPSVPSVVSSCSVSPSNGRFCCDASAIPPIGSWEPGLVVSAKVFDLGQGYVAGPVSLQTTGEGYDVFDRMILQKVISFDSVIPSLVVSSNTSVSLNISVLDPYSNVSVSLGGLPVGYCSNCSSFVSLVNASFGSNELVVSASDGVHTFFENVSFGVVSDISFDRDFMCGSCNGVQIREGDSVLVNLSVGLSHAVSGISFYEFVPVDWNVTFISGSGVLSPYSTSHNRLTWQTSFGSDSFVYEVSAPEVGVRPVWYLFHSQLAGVNLSDEEVLVRGFNQFFPRGSSQRFFSSGGSRSAVHNGRPSVLVDGGLLVGVYVNGSSRDISLSWANSTPSAFDDLLFSRGLSLSVPWSEVDRMYVEYVLNRSEVLALGYDVVELWVFDGSWSQVEELASFFDGDRVVLSAELDPSVAFAFVGSVSSSQGSFPITGAVISQGSNPLQSERGFFARIIAFFMSFFD